MTLSEILERIEAATGPDRELDLDIAIALNQMPDGWNPKDDDRGCYHDLGSICLNPGIWGAPRFTESLDAAVALVERVLPEWEWEIESYGRAGVWLEKECCIEHEFIVDRASLCLALCTALVKALIDGES